MATVESPPDRPQFFVHASVCVLNAAGALLMVQEEKPHLHGRWNLPGGHVDHGETPLTAARRELREETQLDLGPTLLLGVYRGDRSFRFVFRADLGDGVPAAGDEILAVRFVHPQTLQHEPDETLVSPAMLKQILHDLRAGRGCDASLFR